MFFHEKRGSLIELSSDRLTAKRTDSFCNGITFSAFPVPVNEKISLEFLGNTSGWSGALRFGFTSVDPVTIDELPRYAVPDLTNKDGFYAKALTESQAEQGYRLTYHCDSEGDVHFYVNNEYKGVHINNVDVTKPLWALIDIYGVTQQLRFVDPEEAPAEILARGPESMRAFLQASKAGTKPIFRTRLMLVGQDRVGKTSLKKSLTGQRYDSAEESTDGIDTNDACEINVLKYEAWKLHKEDEADENKGVLDGPQGLEEEYARAIANNIVQELLLRKRKNKDDKENEVEKLKKKTDATDKKNKKNQNVSQTDSNKSESIDIQESESKDVDEDLLKDMSDKIVHLVTQMLNEAEKDEDQLMDKQEAAKKKIVLNIWDFAGQAVYYTTHQVFLSSRAVYIIVFNLSHDLDAPAQTQVRRGDGGEVVFEESELSNLDFIDFWMSSIHAHTAQNRLNSLEDETLSPPIFIVGTHKNSLDPDPEVRQKIVESKFRRIRESLKGKPYKMHIVNQYYAVENNLEDTEDEQIGKLRSHIEEVASKEKYMGEQMPIKWLKFEKKVAEYTENKTYYLSRNQAIELGNELGITTDEGLNTMLQFYHDLGVIIYYGGTGAMDDSLQNTIVLKPQWLVDVFKRVITVKDIDEQWPVFIDAWTMLDQEGVLQDKLINHMWRDILEQKNALLGLMEKFDLLCERMPPKQLNEDARNNWEKSYYVPSRLRNHPNKEELITMTKTNAVFYLTFGGFLPDGLFHRMLTRAVRYSQEQGGHEPKLYHREARFYLDEDHDFALEMSPIRHARIKVTVMHVGFFDADDSEEIPDQPPKPEACAKVRHFLDSTLADLREMWIKRIKYEFSVACPCGSKKDEHFLNLDQCLNNKVVLCDHRRIKTNSFKKWFPSKSTSVVAPRPLSRQQSNLRLLEEELPDWMKKAAKLLNAGSEGSDWLALAEKLGYKKAKIRKFNDEVNPALAMLTDWIYSSGNTTLSIEMMLSYLEQMHREDVVDAIQQGQDSHTSAPIFISYNWGIQEEVKQLRDYLEKAGFPCWMDIGQMGGGDTLYERIDDGMRNCKVVIACMTPKYIVSHNCNREISLADSISKPIIPIMYQRIPWPPPGRMSLIFSHLLYVQMKGIGGHGGSGINADTKAKYMEIVDQVQRHVTPLSSPKGILAISASKKTTTVSNPQQSEQTVTRSMSNTYQSSPSIESSRNATTMSQTQIATGRDPTEQVSVSMCTVCSIL
ncbi:neuralized PATS1 [Saccoglossus kowalevskii]|uniref:non-specific serine/threonine protein kinase n=1 Tax=Saccoglossus kowalevskii TaxID=10224 RepID=D1LX78_SACKO|nr:neuralized PATS1 [Saccoglossus kowalevskii]ACY92584.1 neuralized PATS1 [Saccoglossus kowalevskii]